MFSVLSPDIDFSSWSPVAVIAVLAIREFFGYLKEREKSARLPPPLPIKADDNGGKKDAAGLKSAEWWELTFARIVKQCLDDHENRIRHPANEEAQRSREEILTNLRTMERQLGLAVAEIVREIRHS